VISGYFNQKADIWDETVAESDTAKLEGMVRRLNINAGATLLDVGTGTGVFLPFLLDKVGRSGKIVALDFAGEMLKKAWAKGFGENVFYLNAEVASLPLADEIFDVVVCYSSFPHFQDKPKALAEIRRVTKGGGELFICHTSSRAKINEIHSQIPLLANDILPDGEVMQGMLLQAGFVDIAVDDNPQSYLAEAKRPVGRTV